MGAASLMPLLHFRAVNLSFMATASQKRGGQLMVGVHVLGRGVKGYQRFSSATLVTSPHLFWQ